jgi:hypothetical protein
MRASTAAVVLVLCVAGCRDAAQAGPSAAPRAAATTATRCDVGVRPRYFVPTSPGSPSAIIGCARLGVSGKPVELSANRERLDGKEHVCLNPAYGAGRRLGIYIPATCMPVRLLDELYATGAGVPRQGVRGYRLVIWGTAPARTRRVTARYDGGETEAAVFGLETPAPYTVFVVELHREAACRRMTLRATGGAQPGAIRIRRRPRVCPSGV